MSETQWVRKPRGESPGIWHVWNSHQTLCGRRIPGVKARGVPAEGESTCPECLRHQQNGTIGSYRKR